MEKMKAPHRMYPMASRNHPSLRNYQSQVLHYMRGSRIGLQAPQHWQICYGEPLQRNLHQMKRLILAKEIPQRIPVMRRP